MKHTADCTQKTAETEQIRREWVSKWPKYCRTCGGNGLIHDPGYFDYRAGVGLPPSYEPCECTESCRCARCGEIALKDETAEGPCTNCGWNYDDALPYVHECYCWEEGLDEYLNNPLGA